MFFINGSYVTKEEATISIFDLGLLRGFGVFDYLRTYSGKPFHLEEHLLRLQYSAHQLGLELPYSLEELAEIVHEVIAQSNLPEVSIKIVITGGISPDQFTPQSPTCIVFSYPFTPYPSEFYTKGIKVVTTRLMRCFPSSKTTQYIPAIVALQQGRKEQAMEALYVNQHGEILEATTSNFFGVKKGCLYTCMSDEVLGGITREVLFKILKDRFEIRSEPILFDEIGQLDEAFITASNKEIMPVAAIDSTPIGSGKVGPITQEVSALFRQYTQLPEWAPLAIPRYASSH